MSSPSEQVPTIALTALKIRDFRGIASLDLNFRGPDGSPNRLVVLGGPNGCGKTSVLEAAIHVVDGDQTLLGGVSQSDIRGGAENLWIEGEILDLISTPSQSTRHVTTGSHHSSPNSNLLSVWYFPSWRASGVGGPVNVAMARPHLPTAQQQTNRLRLTKHKLINAAAVEKFGGQEALDRNLYSNWISRINASWREFDPSSTAGFHVELADTIHSESGSFDLFYRQANQARLSVDHLSSGQIELLLFIAELTFESYRIGINFIDEPELHLDPQWHRPFLRSLMRIQPKTQFIVTTHSPEIFDAAYSYERHFLVSDEDPRARLWARARPATLEV